MEIHSRPLKIVLWSFLLIICALFVLYFVPLQESGRDRRTRDSFGSVRMHFNCIVLDIVNAMQDRDVPLPETFSDIEKILRLAHKENPEFDIREWLIDPFSGNHLKVLKDGEALLIYSIGPDRQDDGGQLEYDRDAGLYSKGDMTLRIYPPDEIMGEVKVINRGKVSLY